MAASENTVEEKVVTLPEKDKLFEAVWSHRPQIVAELLTSNPSLINQRSAYGDIGGYTPLHAAIRVNNEEIVKILLNNNANIDLVTDKGESPLHLAIYKRNVEIVKTLLNIDVNVNLPDKNGRTPLHWAAYYDQIEIVQLLLVAGANVNVEDNDGKIPLDVAKTDGMRELLEKSIFLQTAWGLWELSGLMAKDTVEEIESSNSGITMEYPRQADDSNSFFKGFKQTTREEQVYEYTSYFQWMPREMAEDILDLVTGTSKLR